MSRDGVPGAQRRGTIIILVAGLASVFAALALAFLVRIRGDAEESALAAATTQAHIMLVAGCSYILEAGRLGWDDPATEVHEEGFGWVDVRDGGVGPRFLPGGAPGFPIGAVARCPMHVMARPPFARQLRTLYNPLGLDPAAPNEYGLPIYRHPDPLPVSDTWSAFAAGDRRPRANSLGLAWFRVKRLSEARFVIACGAGATGGFRDWAEVLATPGAREGFGDRAVFEDVLQREVRLWYKVEWSGLRGDSLYMSGLDFTPRDNFCVFNTLTVTNYSWHNMADLNMLGSIRWIQRLRGPPSDW